MEKDRLNYMEGMVLYKEEDKMKVCLEKIINEFRKDDFFEDEIYEYLKKIIMDVMLKGEFEKWKEIKKLMKD